MTRLRNISIYTIATWSGFYVMLLEMLSGRLMSPYFGNSIYVWGSIIFIFMLGLSVGYLMGGVLSVWRPTLNWLCAMLAGAAILSLPTVLLATPLLGRIADSIVDPRAGSLAAGVVLFFVPAMACGMISPYAVRLLVADPQSSGRSAGYLYFLSTLGSSAGTLMTSFYFVLWFEVNTILTGAMVVSLGMAALVSRVGFTIRNAPP